MYIIYHITLIWWSVGRQLAYRKRSHIVSCICGNAHHLPAHINIIWSLHPLHLERMKRHQKSSSSSGINHHPNIGHFCLHCTHLLHPLPNPRSIIKRSWSQINHFSLLSFPGINSFQTWSSSIKNSLNGDQTKQTNPLIIPLYLSSIISPNQPVPSSSSSPLAGLILRFACLMMTVGNLSMSLTPQ